MSKIEEAIEAEFLQISGMTAIPKDMYTRITSGFWGFRLGAMFGFKLALGEVLKMRKCSMSGADLIEVEDIEKLMGE